MSVRKILFCLLVLPFMLGSVPAAAQQGTPADVRLRLAQSYERSGDFASAIAILRELLKADPGNPTIADELRRDYVELKRYPEAIALLQDQIARRPSDINSASQLASVYYLNSEEEKAYATWEKIISANPKQMISYHMVGSGMTQSRLFDRAIAVYLRGRTACNDPSLFINDVAYLYTLTGRYADATREYLSMLKISPQQLGLVQTSIATYTNRSEGLDGATSVLEDAARRAPGDLPLKRLLAWVYMEGKKYEQAYGVTAAIDNDAKAGGRELHIFADRALREQAYAVAARAFDDIVRRYPSYESLPLVRLGYARALEMTVDEQDTLRLFGNDHPFFASGPARDERAARFAPALEAYRQVAAAYPRTEIAARALLRIGTIVDDRLNDPAAAQSSLETVARDYAAIGPVASEASLRLAGVHVAQERLDPAREIYRRLAGKGLRTTPLQDLAALRLAELFVYTAQFDSALPILRSLSVNTNADVANDAIALQALIEQHVQADRPALERYAKAELLRRERRWNDALSEFLGIEKQYPSSDLRDDALMSAGDLYTILARYPEALATFDTLIARYPKSIAVDETLMKAAAVYEYGMHDKPGAIAAYEKLLAGYPGSIYMAEARKRIRLLRGDAL